MNLKGEVSWKSVKSWPKINQLYSFRVHIIIQSLHSVNIFSEGFLSGGHVLVCTVQISRNSNAALFKNLTYKSSSLYLNNQVLQIYRFWSVY